MLEPTQRMPASSTRPDAADLDGTTCVVIPLFHVERDELFLSREAARWVFADLMLKLGMRMPADHLELFLKRRYRHVDEIRKALARYKVFGDLGYGRV